MYPLAFFLYFMLHFGHSTLFCLVSTFFMFFFYLSFCCEILVLFPFVPFVFLFFFICELLIQFLIYIIYHFTTEQTAIKTKKDDPFVQHLWKQNRLGAKLKDQADMLIDIAIPLFIIIGLLIVNGFIVLVIWRHRKNR